MVVVISTDMIPQIEAALGLKLYPSQISYLVGDFIFCGGRSTGRTTAYMIKLALSEGEPLTTNLKYGGNLIPDGYHGPRYYDWFRKEFLEVHRKLTEYGFKTRRLATG